MRHFSIITGAVAFMAMPGIALAQGAGSQAQPGGQGQTPMAEPGQAAQGMAAQGQAMATADIGSVMDMIVAAETTDQLFAIMASASGAAEVEMSELAAQRATNPDVQQFAQHMIEDHTRANQELQQIAASAGLEIPMRPDPLHQIEMEMAQQVQGHPFDQYYITGQIRDHLLAVQLYSLEADQGQEPALQAFAAEALPLLQQHLQEAQQIQRSMMTAAQ